MNPKQRRAPRNLVSELKSLGERGGSVIGAAYALAARSILSRVERLEDLSAERRSGRRASPPALPSTQKKPLQPAR